MPRGNRQGPWGAGPVSGRGAGWCAGNDRPGFANPTARCGYGFGRRDGRSWPFDNRATGRRGWSRYNYGMMVGPIPEQELPALKAQAQWLGEELAEINQRIDNLERQPSAE